MSGSDDFFQEIEIRWPHCDYRGIKVDKMALKHDKEWIDNFIDYIEKTQLSTRNEKDEK